jgi:hypothetical protein
MHTANASQRFEATFDLLNALESKFALAAASARGRR